MITIEKVEDIESQLEEFFKKANVYQRNAESMRKIIDDNEAMFRNKAAKKYLDYMIKKIASDIQRRILKSGNPDFIVNYVDWEAIEKEGVKYYKPAYVSVMAEAGDKAYEHARIEGSFDVFNPLALDWAESNSLEYVTQITAETKDALRVAIAQNMKDKLTRVQIGRKIGELPLGLNEPQIKAYYKMKENLIADGVKSSVVDRKMKSYYNKLYRERCDSIAKTEVSRSVNEGYLNALETQDTFKKVRLSSAADCCPQCAAMAGNEYTIEDAHGVLPVHPRCRCAWVVVYGEKKYRVENPQLDKVNEFEVAHGGEYHETAYAVDSTGKVLLEKEGGRGYVEFTQSEYDRITSAKNVIFTHTHPGNCSFSGGDFSWLADMDPTSEMRIAGKKYNYSVRMTKKTIMPPSRKEIMKIHNDICKQYHDEFMDMLQEKWDGFRDLGMKSADAKEAALEVISELHSKRVNKDFVKMFNLKYKRIKRL